MAIGDEFKPHSDFVFVFDCETTADVKNELRFGFASVFGIEKSEQVDLWESRQLTREKLDKPHRHYRFYNPNRLKPEELELLTCWVDRFNRDKNVDQPLMFLLPAQKFIMKQFYYWIHEKRALCVGHNLPFDLSRLATDWGVGGKNYTNGFRLVLCDCIERWQANHPDKRTDLQPDDCQFHPYIRVRKLGSKKAKFTFRIVRQDIKNAARPYKGEFLDTATLGRALLGPGDLSLEGLCRRAGVHKSECKFDAENLHGKELNEKYIRYAFQDGRATFALYQRLRDLYRQHDLNTSMPYIYSEASLGKAYFKAMGVPHFQEQHPDTDPRFYGIASQAYYGGRSEVMIRLHSVECMMVDFTSQYPSVNALMANQSLLLAESIERRDNTDWVRAFLKDLSPETLLNPEIWPKLRSMVKLIPRGDILPIRARFAGPADPPNIAVTPVFCAEAIWYTLADVCAAVIMNPGKIPEIEQAYELIPHGMVPTQPKCIFGDESYPIDLKKDDLFKTIIEMRQNIKAKIKSLKNQAEEMNFNNQEIEKLESMEQGLKFLANSTSYGVLAEFVEEDPYETPRSIQLHIGQGLPRPCKTTQFETPGKHYSGEIASFITGGGRLLFALIERLGRDRGISHALGDTDSMVFVRPNGMEREAFQQHIREMIEMVNHLSPYKPGIPLLKSEDVNVVDDELEPLYVLAVSSKRYALYNKRWKDEFEQWHDGIRLRKCTNHGLGSYINPPGYQSKIPVLYAKDDEPICTTRWIDDLWTLAVRKVESGVIHDDTEMILEEEIYDLLGDVPAISKETVSTWEVYKQVDDIPDIRPFSFFVTLPGIEEWMIDERIRRTGQYIQAKPELMGIGYYSSFSSDTDEIMANLTNKDTHERIPHALTATLAEKVLHYFAHAEHKAYPPHGIGQLQKQSVIVEALAYCGKESQTLYSYSEDGESNGTTLIGEEQAQIFQIEAPQDLTIMLDIPVKTLINLGVSKDRICKEFGISNKTLSNILSGQQVSHSLMEHYVRLFQAVCSEKKLSLEDFKSSSLESGSVADELKALIAQGWTVPKIAHELGKSERQVNRWRKGTKCKREIRGQVMTLLMHHCYADH
ncbi:MAG: helix-turn-helix domain-containing protein [Proteobacteria bacterium]|nr:helix-turn-helix domain-containing protein [Pseudomonadota bacterium]